MRNRPDIIAGTKMNRLTVIRQAAPVINHKGYKTRMVEVRCDCGTVKTIRAAAFFSEHLKSCGCLKVEKFVARTTTHGDTAGRNSSKEYRAWHDAIERCERASHPGYKNYGGRGINVCERWRNNYAAFLEDMGRAPSQRHSIDRINVDGGYAPDNCRWATPRQQARNTTKSRFIEHDGIRLTVAEWSERTGLSKDAILYRLKAGWPLNIALSRPSGRGRRL